MKYLALLFLLSAQTVIAQQFSGQITIDSITVFYDASYENKIDYSDFTRPVLTVRNCLSLTDYLQIRMSYPELAKAAKIEATKTLMVKIDKTGSVELQSGGKNMGWGTDEECIRAFSEKIKVTPGKIGDKPIDTYTMVTVNFRFVRSE